MDIIFKLAQPADAELLMQLMREYCAFDHLPFDEQTRRRTYGQFLGDESQGRLWLILSEGAPVGYLILTFGFSFEYGGRDAFLDEVYLCEPHRGRGIGKRAIDFAEKQCRALGVGALHLEVKRENTNAHALYRQVGFIEHDRYLLTKHIPPFS
ncbi:MAG TPA: GNAT family N-acetyltransferase [Methylomirabilota bacterium]|nr:GNAT family N-acetyltransferase [Methylomirabilota bacterium]